MDRSLDRIRTDDRIAPYAKLEIVIAARRIQLRKEAIDAGIALEETPPLWPLPAPAGDLEAYTTWLMLR